MEKTPWLLALIQAVKQVYCQPAWEAANSIKAKTGLIAIFTLPQLVLFQQKENSYNA